MEYSNLKEIGGYDAHFLDDLLNDYECPVCKMALRKPVQTQCGHRLCLSCSEEIKKRKGVLICPLDNSISICDKTFLDIAFERVVLQLKVKCNNFLKNCLWTGELKLMNNHLKDCEYEDVKCNNRECSVLTMRKELNNHMETRCSYRFVFCQYCNEKIYFFELQVHFEKCECFPLDCVNQCGLKVLRKEMTSHITDDCVFTLISCQYLNIERIFKGGCAKRFVKNILLLGETGVGKSTWINGIANYFQFNSLDDACNGYINVHIPTSIYKFNTEIKLGRESKIEIPNHVGQSTTQCPRMYTLTKDGKSYINLIDTPGIGGTKETDKDIENFNVILEYVSKIKEIDAICIFLRSNNSQLTLGFRYCIQELLIKLHASVKNNILFCFTHSRSTFYTPGDTLSVLNKELADKKIGIDVIFNYNDRSDKKNNCFCFDNEAFRYLVCFKNGITFPTKIQKFYAESWYQTKNETLSLFKKLNFLVPFNVADTINVNQARNISFALSKSIEECLNLITDNTRRAEEINNQIQATNIDIVNIKTTLKFKDISLETTYLNYPVTVCTHKDCVEYILDGKSQKVNIHYKTICHNYCILKNSSTQISMNHNLAKHEALSKGLNCKACSHSNDVHIQRTYITTKVEKEFISEDVQKLILLKMSKLEQIEEVKKQTLSMVEELHEEKKNVLEVAAMFGAYLIRNALIVHNDVFGEYIKSIIEQENKKPITIKDLNKIKELTEILNSYETRKKNIMEAISKGENENKVFGEYNGKLKDRLFSLRHMGKTMRTSLIAL